MKKVIYAILVCIIIAGAIITCTIGLKADIVYSKNVQIEIYLGKTFEIKDIKKIVDEVFPGERKIVENVELFNDMVVITLPEKTDEELKTKIEELNTKINEKYEIENIVDDIVVSHNPKIRLSSILKPYILPIAISVGIILVYVLIRYRKLGALKTIANYILTVGAVEAVYLSMLAITRFPINRLVIPIGLTLYVITVTALCDINEGKLHQMSKEQKKK